MALKAGIEDYQAKQEQHKAPLRERLELVEDLIANNREQYEWLLDLYVAGDVPKEMLIDRKTSLETAIEALEKERASLSATLKAQKLTQDQIQSLQGFAREVADGLEVANQDFATRRRIIETLDVTVTLVVENGEKAIYAQFWLGKQVLPIAPNSTTVLREVGESGRYCQLCWSTQSATHL